MIELKDISKEERGKILLNFEYFSNLIWRKDNVVRSVHKQLSEVVGVGYEEELWIVLTHIGKCIRYGTNGYFFSLKNDHYSAANKTYNVSISPKRMKELLLRLESLGYVDFYLGFYKHNVDSSLSALGIKDSLYALFNIDVIKKQGSPREDISDAIEIVDTEKTTVTKKFSIQKGKIVKMKDVKFKSTKGVSGVSKLKKDLLAYNKLIENNTITIDVGNGDEGCNSIVYKRRFEDNLQTCGRYYDSSSFQTLPSEYRKSIKINGEDTIELDFTCSQPRLCADIEGIQLSETFDCYTVPSLIDLGMSRDMIKSMLFPVLFTDSIVSATRSIRLKLTEFGITNVKAAYVVKEFMNHNSFLEDYFFTKDLYGELQFIDSSIATLVINHFTSKGVVVLCYHDSFRIQSKYEYELYQVMKDSYLTVVGCNKNMLITKSE